jgi:Dolichyl-phosphate-mannose-protein mannosyltransferase
MNGQERSATAILMGLALVTLAIHVATNGIYGFLGDELYYIASGNHPAFGYVDYPPLVPLLALLETSVLGTSQWALRLLHALVGAAIVVLAGLCAREMGAGPRAQVAAGVLTAISPFVLGAHFLFGTVSFDQLTWVVTLYLLLRLLRTRDRRLWLLLGFTIGVGMETKITIAALAAGLAVAVVASPLRPHLTTRWPWLGAFVAIALAAPYAIWNVVNGLPTLAYTHNHAADIANSGGVTNVAFEYLLLAVGVGLVPLWVYGLVWLWRSSLYWPLLAAVAVATLILLPNGKAYYPAPAVPVVIAAAVTGLGKSTVRRRTIRISVAAGAALNLILLPLALPLVPPADLHTTHIDTLRPDFASTVGWPEVTQEIATAYLRLPMEQRQSTAILSAYYSTAGAVDVFGPALGLPSALSPHLTYWFWKPTDVTASSLLVIGYQPEQLTSLCGQVTQVGTVIIPNGVINNEQGKPIFLRTALRQSLDAAWPSMKNFS